MLVFFAEKSKVKDFYKIIIIIIITTFDEVNFKHSSRKRLSHDILCLKYV